VKEFEERSLWHTCEERSQNPCQSDQKLQLLGERINGVKNEEEEQLYRKWRIGGEEIHAPEGYEEKRDRKIQRKEGNQN
jgi:hypothetical protein